MVGVGWGGGRLSNLRMKVKKEKKSEGYGKAGRLETLRLSCFNTF